MRMRCAVVDDEPLARECVVGYINQVEFFELAGTASNTIALTKLMNEQVVDLIFLDIQMPGVNGIDFLKMSRNLPITIITTAYPSYALEGFQLDVLDYLVKPITFDRFFKGATKASEYYRLMNQPQVADQDHQDQDYFFVKCDYRFEKIFYKDIDYIEGMQNYVTIHTEKGKYVTLFSMKRIEENLTNKPFIRIHKSYIVSIDKVISIANNELILKNNTVPISRNYRDAVISSLVDGKLWKK